MSKSAQLRILAILVIMVAALFATTGAAQAQATRTWVSGVGDDANPCSRTAPCKTFAGAISKTAPCGEIDVLDPGGFGALTITKCISIESEGVIAGVLVSGTNGFVIAAGANDNVVIRGLTFEGLGTGLAGIKVISAGSVHIENCFINNFIGAGGSGTGSGIDVEPGSPTTNLNLSIKDTVVRDGLVTAGTFGILIKPAAGVTVNGDLDHVRVENNAGGLRVEGGSKVSVHDSDVSNNKGNGVISVATGVGGAEVNLQSVTISSNTANGVTSSAAGSIVRISNVAVWDNGGLGLNPTGGTIVSFKNNSVQGNVGGDGAPSSSPGQI